MDHEFTDGRLSLRRTREEREPILRRLRRIEGQVRGLQEMLKRDRYCLEELQQARAVIAAMREVSFLISGQHLAAGIENAAQSDKPQEVLEELKTVMRSAIRQP